MKKRMTNFVEDRCESCTRQIAIGEFRYYREGDRTVCGGCSLEWNRRFSQYLEQHRLYRQMAEGGLLDHDMQEPTEPRIFSDF